MPVQVEMLKSNSHPAHRRAPLPTAAPIGVFGLPLPPWVPDRVRHYLFHTENGVSLRALARESGLNPSTVMRQVRHFENRRDDPLMDGALAALGRSGASGFDPCKAEEKAMIAMEPGQGMATGAAAMPDAALLEREARRVLRRLAEPGAVLAFARDMDKAAVLREFPDGRTARTAVMERAVAQAFSLKDWIACRSNGRVSSYEITAAGRMALRRILGEDMARRAPGLHEAAAIFVAEDHGEDDEGAAPRAKLVEAPVQVLARRRDRDGRPFLGGDLVAAAERLREDFELSQMGQRHAQNWERFMTGGADLAAEAARGGDGAARARGRVAAALADLGPGLGDVALRVCCHLEGVESAERRMGWAARSGKVVLRIALLRLRRHYDETYGRAGPLIG